MNMKQRFFILLTILVSSTQLLNCADELDIAPRNSIDSDQSLNTSADVEALLKGAYDALADGDLYGGNLLRDSELLGDGGEVFWDGTFVDPGEMWTKNILITNGQVENTWLDAYETINMCNTVIANLNLVTPDRKDRVEGEAKFIRGTVYFELVRVFARTWTDGSPATNPGVPLVLEPTTEDNATEKINRSTVTQVYAQVISDLTEAEAKLPEENKFYATTYAASGMLSRVYLAQNDYAKARDAADRVIESGVYELARTYADAFNKGSQESGNASIEDIFSIQVTSQDGVNNMNTFFATSDFGGRGDIYVEPAHFDLYEPGDDRLNLFYDDERTGKWNNQFGNVNIIRLAEMYLTRAEANFRLGTSVGATPEEDIDLIRERVGLAPIPVLTLDQILLERHLELAFEGHLLHDLKRTQSDVGGVPFNDPSLIYPVPQRERIINPDLQQNTGYGS
jgi:starch-binding outer membrane protein, SusD/RagB family